MRGSTSIPLVRSIRKHFYPSQGSWGGIVPSLELKKQGNEETGKQKTIQDEKVTEPIVAFSRPPPLPSFLGPLVALSVLESCSRSDSNDV